MFGNILDTQNVPNIKKLSNTITHKIGKIKRKFNQRYKYILERAKRDFSVVKSKFMEFLESKSAASYLTHNK